MRRTESLRALVRETSLEPGDLILPLFICPGEGVRHPVGSMPGVFNLSVDEAVREAEEAARLGIGGLLRLAFRITKTIWPREPGLKTALCNRRCER